MKNLMTCLLICAWSAAAYAGAGVTGTIDASPYTRLLHDVAANSLALALTKSSGTVTGCTFTIYDPKAQKKVDSVTFAEGVGAGNVSVAHFDKKWAVLLVQTAASDTCFSIMLVSIALSFIYSAPPFRLKKFFLLPSLILGLEAMLVLLLGQLSLSSEGQ